MRSVHSRRRFLRLTGATALGASSATGRVAAANVTATNAARESESAETVAVGPGGDLTFEPAVLHVEPGATVRWVWGSDTHNVVPSGQPMATDWEGHQDIEDAGFEYEYTFEEVGAYEYICEPHVTAGMEGRIVVGDPDPTFDGDVLKVSTGSGTGNNVFEPDDVVIEPGTTVRWVWNTDTHNIVPTAQPEDSDWEGHLNVESAGFEHEHVFEVEGIYEYTCEPHPGMEGRIVVQTGSGSADGVGEEGGDGEDNDDDSDEASGDDPDRDSESGDDGDGADGRGGNEGTDSDGSDSGSPGAGNETDGDSSKDGSEATADDGSGDSPLPGPGPLATLVSVGSASYLLRRRDEHSSKE